MELTELKINPNKNPGRTRANCEATLDNFLVVSNVRIHEGPKGLRVRFPANFKTSSNRFRQYLEKRILATWVVNHVMNEYSV